MTDNEIIKALEHCTQYNCFECPRYHETPYDADICTNRLMGSALDLINRQKAEIEALTEKLNATIAGQETLQKALADKINESEKQSQNFKVLVSDHRTLQQSFDNLKGLYEEQKARVKKAKEKSIYFAKELQKARAETDKVTALAAEWKDVAYTYADNIDRIKADAIKEFVACLKATIDVDLSCGADSVHYLEDDLPNIMDDLVKEMVGES